MRPDSPLVAAPADASLGARGVFAATLGSPAQVLTMVGCGLMMFACATSAQLGHHAVSFKLHYAQLFMVFAVVLAGRRLLDLRPAAWRGASGTALRAAPWCLALCALVGVHGLVSNGIDYQTMAADYWNTDPFLSSSRRLGMPVLAHLLTFDLGYYTAFWYATLAATFWAAHHLLVRRGLTRFEALSVATSSILAYALEGPGYGEIAVLLLGIVLLRFRATPIEKAVAAAFLIATHETATPFVAATLVLAGDADERRDWLVLFGLLYLALAASFVVTWHGELGGALLRAGKANAGDEMTSPELVAAHPGLAALGVLAGYKLVWLPLLSALGRRESRPVALLAVASTILVFAGSDTSRLVQFGSLPMFLAVCAELRRWSAGARRTLAVGNLLLPSVYVATNAGVLWGPGLYSLYLRGAEGLGLAAGQIWR